MWLGRCVSEVERTWSGSTQAQFVARFGFWSTALRHRAHGDHSPHGNVLALLNVIDRNPRATMRALR
jgi:DNA-binding transcriptional regulator YiaG